MNIKKVIKENGYTIQGVAKKIGVNRVTLQLTLQGNPTYNKLRQIADAIDCDVMDFFKDEAIHQQNNDIESLPSNVASIICPNCGKELDLHLELKEKKD